MAKKDKWRSSYDPMNNGGKIPMPREPEPMQLRGCGDPTCSECNPESAAALGSARAGISGRGVFTSVDFSAVEARSAAMQREMARMGRGYLYGTWQEPAKPAKPSGPPATYTAAREKVERWLVAAPAQSFDDIVGNEDALNQLRDAIQAPIKHKELYESYGMKMPKGALLCGPPGCGKTMFARAAASEMKRLYGETTEFLLVAGSSLQTMYVGQTEAYIRAIFDFAREYKAYRGHPLLVFMDEAEVLLPDRTGRIRRVAPWEESQVSTFLAEMDGVTESGAFVLLATNRPEVIDQAVLRDGRCDFKITVKRPTHQAIEVILQKTFAGILTKEPVESLVMAAVEGLFDPHKVLMEAHAIGIDFEKQKLKDFHNKHFLLEHIVSGAMATSIPARAKRYAFARDRDSGTITGVQVMDVIRAVNDLFEENKRLTHEFALNEFREQFMIEAQAAVEHQTKPKGPTH
jgi:SpoVK/Ycf46/Vps4 family AAA+-type ATPase